LVVLDVIHVLKRLVDEVKKIEGFLMDLTP
jgi:hypothetical protein